MISAALRCGSGTPLSGFVPTKSIDASSDTSPETFVQT
jgi:hypothetical protein